MRSFDPVKVGKLECDSWVAYYGRRWPAFLRAALGLTREAFGLSLIDTLRGAWWVMRANQAWAPYPDNDPESARSYMERFYRMVRERNGEAFDPPEAARREVAWWRAHRERQYGPQQTDATALVDSLVRLYAYVYSVPMETVRTAAEERAVAMLHSDRWVAEGCERDSPLIGEERVALVRSYEALLAAVRR